MGDKQLVVTVISLLYQQTSFIFLYDSKLQYFLKILLTTSKKGKNGQLAFPS